MFKMPGTQLEEKGIKFVNIFSWPGPEAALQGQRQNPKSYSRTLCLRSEFPSVYPQLAGRFFKTKSGRSLILKMPW